MGEEMSPLKARLLLSFALVMTVTSSCRRAEGECTGKFEGQAATWKIDGESFMRAGSRRSIHLGYEAGPATRYLLDMDLTSNALSLPHEQELAKNDRGEVMNPTLVTWWAEQRLIDEQGNVPWAVEPSRTVTLATLNEDEAVGRLLLDWGGADQMTCTFDLPAVPSSATEGRDGPTPCGFHGC